MSIVGSSPDRAVTSSMNEVLRVHFPLKAVQIRKIMDSIVRHAYYLKNKHTVKCTQRRVAALGYAPSRYMNTKIPQHIGTIACTPTCRSESRGRDVAGALVCVPLRLHSKRLGHGCDSSHLCCRV
jgi:hypothetical protein